MGVPLFFQFIRSRFSKHIVSLDKKNKYKTFRKKKIDALLLDMNGIFHNSAQKIFKYGNHEEKKRILGGNQSEKKKSFKQQQLRFFRDISMEICNLFYIINPQKYLVLCVDGVAPLSKQNQQRQRRYKTKKTNIFNPNCITPGTLMMDYLTKYIDWFIKKKISTDRRWKKVKVIFSNEKNPGEGEHKILNFIRYLKQPDLTYCIYGLDADLIMLALGTHLDNMYILRDDTFNLFNDYYLLNIGGIRIDLIEILRWEGDMKFIEKYAINDFIFLCFMIGNDFLPHIPSLEIFQNGIQNILNMYIQTCQRFGHITVESSRGVIYDKTNLTNFLGILGNLEVNFLEDKINSKKKYFEDLILKQAYICNNNSSSTEESRIRIDIIKYKKLYYKQNLNLDYDDKYKLSKLCYEYLKGLQWVLSYYLDSIPDWFWTYKYYYAPFSSDLKEYSLYYHTKFLLNRPLYPFEQLLCVLPSSSLDLLPSPLNTVDKVHPSYFIDKFKIDLNGKRKDWEGIALIPFINLELFINFHYNYNRKLDYKDKKRNRSGKSFIYYFDPDINFVFYSYYGDISDCAVKIELIKL